MCVNNTDPGFILLKIVDMVMGLRVTEEQEREGLDIAMHGERVE